MIVYGAVLQLHACTCMIVVGRKIPRSEIKELHDCIQPHLLNLIPYSSIKDFTCTKFSMKYRIHVKHLVQRGTTVVLAPGLVLYRTVQ